MSSSIQQPYESKTGVVWSCSAKTRKERHRNFIAKDTQPVSGRQCDLENHAFSQENSLLLYLRVPHLWSQPTANRRYSEIIFKFQKVPKSKT